MEKCKYCGAELEENARFCTECGKEIGEESLQQNISDPTCDADNAQQMTAQEAAEVSADAIVEALETAKKKKTPVAKIALAVISVVVVLAVLVGIVLSGKTPADTQNQLEQPDAEETTEATIPADGNPDDVTCKGTYTADDAAVIAARDVVVATCGAHELTVGQLQAAYWMEVSNFLNAYGSYASYYGLDYTQPLDTQLCYLTEQQMTWQQFFLEAALNSWLQYNALTDEAVAKGFQPSEEMLEFLDNAESNLAETAADNGYENVEDMIHKILGNAATVQDYMDYVQNYYWSYEYYNFLVESAQPTEEDLENYFAANEDTYAQNGITKDSVSVDVRHILIYPEGADSATVRTEEFSEESWAAGKENAETILNEWLAGDKTEESFAALAQQHSGDPGSAANGGLYTGVTEGQMVQSFNDWCFDASRQIGDYGIVQTEYGYHIMYFCGSNPLWRDHAQADYVNEMSNQAVTEICEAVSLNVDYSKILLALVTI